MQSIHGMDKYLFTDGTVVKEAASKQELQSLADEVPDPRLVKVWIFNSHEWISWSSFLKKNNVVQPAKETTLKRSPTSVRWLKNFLFIICLAGGALLIFNFTSVKWEKAGTFHSSAIRPDNVPLMDIDSLINLIELQRGKLLDKSTRTNFRLRNNWPDWITVDLNADKESSSAGIRFNNVTIKVDNSTGFNIDNAVIKLQLWKSGKIFSNDTLQFKDIGYGQSPTKELPISVKADSLSLSFQSIRARSFNFCYSGNIKNDQSKFYDRWFCRDVNE